MLIRLTKISDVLHRLTVVRDDRSEESVDLASRSLLLHDFLHYAVESIGGLRSSFWGSLAAGKTMAELGAAMRPPEGITPALLATEAATTEAIVGCFTTVAHGRSEPATALAVLAHLFEAQERPLPEFLTPAFGDALRDRIRRLVGEWRAVPYGGTMELRF